MTTEKNALLPSVHWPVVIADVTVWPDGKKAKVSLDISATIFSSFQDYKLFFAGLDVSIPTIHAIATKGTKEYKNMKTSIEHELNQLKSLIQQTSHYKALLLMEPVAQTTNDTPTISKDEQTQKHNEIINTQAWVILGQKDLRLNPSQIKALDNYYRLALQDGIYSFQNEKVIVDEVAKQITINAEFHDITDQVFAALKKPKKSETPYQQTEKKQWLLGKLLHRTQKEPSLLDQPKSNYNIQVGVIQIKTAYGVKCVVLEFLDSGQRLKNQIIGSLCFRSITEEEAAKIDGKFDPITIDHPYYIEQKMR